MTGDNRLSLGEIQDDALLPFIENLASIGECEKISLFIYSRGGGVDMPRRMMARLREKCPHVEVLVPYKAHSAATLIALGADKIVMGKNAELGPIDPRLKRPGDPTGSGNPIEIEIEDVWAYVKFLKDDLGLKDDGDLSWALSPLTDSIGAVNLGSVTRQRLYIRLAARLLLESQAQPLDNKKINPIVKQLTEEMYFHGHTINRHEATEMGLPIETADNNVEQAMWELFEGYAEMLKLRESIDVYSGLVQSTSGIFQVPDFVTACIESKDRTDAFTSDIEAKPQRNVPQNLQIPINLNLQLPANINPAQLPQQAQQILQQIVQQAVQQLQQQVTQQVQDELNKTAPMTGADVKHIDPGWKDITSTGK